MQPLGFLGARTKLVFAIGLCKPGTRISVNFGQKPFKFEYATMVGAHAHLLSVAPTTAAQADMVEEVFETFTGADPTSEDDEEVAVVAPPAVSAKAVSTPEFSSALRFDDTASSRPQTLVEAPAAGDPAEAPATATSFPFGRVWAPYAAAISFGSPSSAAAAIIASASSTASAPTSTEASLVEAPSTTVEQTVPTSTGTSGFRFDFGDSSTASTVSADTSSPAADAGLTVTSAVPANATDSSTAAAAAVGAGLTWGSDSTVTSAALTTSSSSTAASTGGFSFTDAAGIVAPAVAFGATGSLPVLSSSSGSLAGIVAATQRRIRRYNVRADLEDAGTAPSMASAPYTGSSNGMCRVD